MKLNMCDGRGSKRAKINTFQRVLVSTNISTARIEVLSVDYVPTPNQFYNNLLSLLDADPHR
jgi:hypothetical protein